MTDPALFPPPPPEKESPGPVYQGVCAQIRALTTGPDPIIDKRLWAGTIAQARSLAASIDRVDGRRDVRGQANGVPLAQMHQQLDALMTRLNPEAERGDTLDQLLEEFRREEADRARRATETPHPPQ